MAQLEMSHGHSYEELLALAHTSPSGLAWVTNLRKKNPSLPNQTPSRWIHAKHIDLLDQWLIRLHARELLKDGYAGLIVEEPPRHGKSELGTHYDSVYYLGSHPDDRVILVTYSGDFSADWGRKCRDTMEEWGPILYGIDVNPRSNAADRWDIKGHRGGMVATGGTGKITGRGADFLKVDDLIKDYEQAQSETIRDKQWNLWQSTYRTRLEPGGIILVIGTRWHEDDIIGRLLRRAGQGPKGELDDMYEPGSDRFVRIRLPAISEPPDDEFPEGDMLGREPGEPLFQERFPLPVLEKIRANTKSTAIWEALYQQRPTPKEGGIFEEDWFEKVQMRDVPKLKKMLRYWDMAATEEKPSEDPDYTVGMLGGVDEEGDLYILDMIRFREAPGQTQKNMKKAAEFDRHIYKSRVRIRLEQEPGAAGKMVIYNLARTIFKGYAFRGHRTTGSKVLRAETAGAGAEYGQIKVVVAPWNWDFFYEVTRFPNAAHDDCVDALSGLYEVLMVRKNVMTTA